jgi:hypothetical protein
MIEISAQAVPVGGRELRAGNGSRGWICDGLLPNGAAQNRPWLEDRVREAEKIDQRLGPSLEQPQQAGADRFRLGPSDIMVAMPFLWNSELVFQSGLPPNGAFQLGKRRF